jgi:quercetin dioxygenase-like cupin family protein
MRRLSKLILSNVLVAAAAAVYGDSKEPALAVAFDDSALKWGACPAFMPKGCGLAVLHGDPSKNNADVFLKIPAGAEIARHWHTSAERMVLAAGELTVAYDGQAPATLKPGMYAYGPAKAPHKASCGKNAACVLFIAFEAPVDAVKAGAERP